MITINKSFNITHPNPDFEYTYTWMIDCPDNCITVDSIEGTTTETSLDFTFSVLDVDCMGDCTINLIITNENGCITTYPVVLEDPCTNLSLSPITNPQGFTFVTLANGNCMNYDYDWTFDRNIFESKNVPVNNNSNMITLCFPLETFPENENTNSRLLLPETTKITVTVTDCNGCTATAEYIYSFCKPMVNTISIDTQCFEATISECGQIYSYGTINLNELTQSCPNDSIVDYTFTTEDSNVCIKPAVDDFGFYGIYDTLNETRTVTIYVTAISELGIHSEPTPIYVNITECTDIVPIYIPPKQFQIECDDIVNDKINIPTNDTLENCIFTDATIDWNSLNIVTAPTEGTVTLETTLNGFHYFEYTFNNASTASSDSFSWEICNTNTPVNCSNVQFWTIIQECSEPPIANDDEICIQCGQSLPIEILLNDVAQGNSSLDPNSVQIINGPTYGTYTINNGVLTYTAPIGFSGTDTITYVVSANNNAGPSDPATITIDILCPADAINQIICN